MTAPIRHPLRLPSRCPLSTASIHSWRSSGVFYAINTWSGRPSKQVSQAGAWSLSLSLPHFLQIHMERPYFPQMRVAFFPQPGHGLAPFTGNLAPQCSQCSRSSAAIGPSLVQSLG